MNNIPERLELLERKYTSLEVLYHQRDSLQLSGELVDAIIFELGRVTDEVSRLLNHLPFYS